MKRKNLEVEVRAHATRVLMQGTRATGVEYVKGGQTMQANAEREVILCGGAFNTPQLLMLSGIGPADHLREVGIEPRRRSAGRQEPAGPSRGADHVRARRRQRVPRRTCGSTRWRSTCCARISSAPGPRPWCRAACTPSSRRGRELAVPDIEFMFRGAPPDAALWFPGWKRPLCRRLRHPAGAPASRQPRRGAAALGRSARSGAHRSELLHRAERPADLARRASRSRARSRRSRRSIRSAAPRLRPGRTVQDRRRDRRLDQEHGRSPRTIRPRPAPWASGPTRARSANAGARRRAAARGRRLGHARSGLGPHQRLRADDGGEGLRPDPRPAGAGAGAAMSTRTQVGEFTVTAVSDGVLYSNHDVILGIDTAEQRAADRRALRPAAAARRELLS